jgi:YegS/Rv2252/BmrU family lipid kinase
MRYRFVVNPSAARVRYAALCRALREEFAGFECEFEPAAPAGDAETITVAAGGDGTVHGVLPALAETRRTLGILPLGGANDFARRLRIPNDFREACRVLRRGRIAEIDLARVNGVPFATGGGMGLVAAISARANRWKAGRMSRAAKALGACVYPLAALREIARGWEPLDATVEDLEESGLPPASYAAILVTQQARIGRWFCPSPTASPSHGRLHICAIVSPRTRRRMLWISLQLMLGRSGRCREIRHFDAARVTIRTDRRASFCADGEVLATGRCFRLEVVRRGLRVVVPADFDAEEVAHAG